MCRTMTSCCLKNNQLECQADMSILSCFCLQWHVSANTDFKLLVKMFFRAGNCKSLCVLVLNPANQSANSLIRTSSFHLKLKFIFFLAKECEPGYAYLTFSHLFLSLFPSIFNSLPCTEIRGVCVVDGG